MPVFENCLHFVYKRGTLCVFDSLSGGEENLEKLAELERLLAQAQTDKLKLVEEQVRKHTRARACAHTHTRMYVH